MNPSVRISWGELIDKITILEIKSERLASKTARENVCRELAELSILGEDAASREPKLAALKQQLKHINETLWKIEDDIRDMEARKSFDEAFIALARAVYRNNDERARLKQEINRLLRSDIAEEKQYSRY